MLVLLEAAFAVSVIDVLLFTERTVPMTTFPTVLMMLPTLTCVRKEVPTPVTLGEALDVVICPVRVVLGHAVALQLPVAAAVIVAACSGASTLMLIMRTNNRSAFRESALFESRHLSTAGTKEDNIRARVLR